MSTYIHLQCVSHDPPLAADGESGQHLYDLPQLREDIAHRVVLVAAARLDVWPDEYFRRNTVAFLVRHESCEIEIWDEYGVQHPLVEEVPS